MAFIGNQIITLNSLLDLDGQELVLDADADSTIHVSTDDQIDFRAGGTDVMAMSTTGLTITNASNDAQLILKSTDADANVGPLLKLQRDSASGADNDAIGEVTFNFDNDAQEETVGTRMRNFIIDASDGSESAAFDIFSMKSGSLTSIINYDATTLSFNDGSANIDFRVESDGDTHALFVDAGNDNVGIGTSSVAAKLHVQNGDGSITPSVHADELLIENSANSGITIGSGTSSFGGVRFADSGGDSRGNITYSHADDRFQISTADSQVARILSNGALQVKVGGADYDDWASNASQCQINTDETSVVTFTVNAQTTSFGLDVQRLLCDRTNNSAYDFLTCTSGNLGDDEYNLRGDGNALADGSFSGGGADYAEYFEWKDGNTSNEDRVGISVKLDGNMIVASSDSDNASDIIGVISANPAVVGDAAYTKWNEKYLRDDFGRYIREEYTVTQWQEKIEGEIDNQNKSFSYETDKIPSDVTVPKDAKVLTVDDNGVKFTRRKLNPNYDKSKTYVSRENRKEWDTVGLMGKLRIKKGQKTGTNWIKMRDISDTVEEWLVR